MYSKFVRFIQSENLLQNIRHIEIALSGGADSVCLTALLARYALENPGIQLRAHHIRHGMRDSDEFDAKIAKTIADRFHIPFIQTNLRLGPITENAEDTARRARYHALFASIPDLQLPSENICLATAHHGDENVETLIWKLSRGCGLESLSLAPRRFVNGIQIIRPLLPFSKSEVYDFLNDNHIPWAEDPTNQSNHYLRNRIRHEVLPPLYQNAPNPDKIYTSLIDIRHDAEALSHLADAFVLSHPCHFNSWFCPYSDWDKLGNEAQIQILRHAAHFLDNTHITARDFILKSCEMIRERSQTHQIQSDEVISISHFKQGIEVSTNLRPPLTDPIPIPIPSQNLNIHGLYQISVFPMDISNLYADFSFKNTPSQLLMDFSHKDSPPGSFYIHPAGHFKKLITTNKSSTRLTEALRSQGIPSHWRPYWPVLCDEEHSPLWVLGGMRTPNASPPKSAHAIMITLMKS